MSYRNARNYENLQLRIFDGAGEYGIPRIEPVHFSGGCEFISFSDAAGEKRPRGKGVHFFIDDYRFNRVWKRTGRYISLLGRFDYVMSPDFSTYADFPKAMQIYNHYRKHWVGAYLQGEGMKVIPTISWSTPESYEWCFDGEPAGGAVAVSSVGCMRDKWARELFLTGYNEMLYRLRPETIIFYGKVPNECSGNIVRIRAFQDKFGEDA